VVRAVRAVLVVAVVAAFIAGCGDDDGDAADPSSLEGMPWVLVDGIDVEGWEAAAPSATFEEGRVSGSTGCNR
jgi:heat shock protein HslJ